MEATSKQIKAESRIGIRLAVKQYQQRNNVKYWSDGSKSF